VDKIVKELEKYADLDSSAAMDSLVCCYHNPLYFSSEFNHAVKEEIKRQVENYRTRTKIVKKRHTIETTELEWII